MESTGPTQSANTRRGTGSWRDGRDGRRFPFLPVFLTFLLLMLATPFVLVRVTAVRQMLVDLATARLGLRGRVSVRIAEVPRCDPWGIELRGVGVAARSGDGEWQSVASIERLTASWSLHDIFIGRARILSARVDSLWLEGQALAALQDTSAAPARAERSALALVSAPPPLTIDALRVGPVLWRDASGTRLTAELSVSDLQTSGDGFFAHIDSGRVAWPRQGLVGRLQGGRASMSAGGVLRVSGVRLEAGGTRAQLRAQFDPHEALLPLSLFLDCERINPHWLIDRAGWSLAATPRDSLAGIIDLHLGARGGYADLVVDGVLLGEPLRELTARIAARGEEVSVEEFHLHAAVGRISGRGELRWDAREATLALDWQELDLGSAWLPWLHRVPLGQWLGGSAQVELKLPRDAPAEIRGALSLRDARPWGIDTRAVHWQGQVRLGDEIRAERLVIEFPDGRMEASGRWPLGGGGVAIAATLDAAALTALPASWRGDLIGSVSGAVRLHGAPHDPLLEGELRVRSPAFRGWRADSLTAGPVQFHPATLRGVAATEFWGVGKSAPLATRVTLGLTLRDEELSLSGWAATGHGALSWRATLDAAEGVRVAEAHLRGTPMGDWELHRPLQVSWEGGTLRVDSLVWASGASRVMLQGHWARETNALAGEFVLERFALAALSGLWSGPDSLRGLCDLRLQVGGRLPDPTLAVRLAAEDLQWRELALGRATLAAEWCDGCLRLTGADLHGQQHHLRVDSLRLDVDRPLFEAFGWRSGPAESAATIPLAAAPWRGTLAVDSLSLSVLLPLFDLAPVRSEEGAERARYYSIAGQMVPIRIVTPWDARPGGSGGSALRGVLGGRIDVSGAPRAPVLRAQLSVPALRFGRIPLGDLSATLTYADSLVTLERVQLARQGQTSWVRGYYPLAFAVLPGAAVALPEPVGIQAGIDALDLALLSGLTRWLPDASGTLYGQLALEGTGVAPELRGTLELQGGGFRIPGRSERIYAADAVFDVRRNGVRIRSLDARTGPEGTVTAVGNFAGPGDFDLSAHIENARIFEEGRYEFIATADLHAYTEPGEGQAATTPHLQGAIEVHSGTLTQSLAAEGGGAPGGGGIPWIIDLDVEIPERIQVSQVNAKADVGEGELAVSYRWPVWTADGTVKILDGTYRLLGNTFTITGGTLEIRDSGAGPDVTAEIDAETHVAVASEEEGPTETVTIEVHVYGQPAELQVELSSTPALSEEEIFELLSYGRFTRGGRFEPIAETQWLLFNTMIDRIETSLVAQTALFSRVTLNTGSTTDEPLRVTVRPIVRPGFMVNYSQDLALDPSGELLFNYRLTRALYLHGGLFRHREGSGDLIDEYGLDLKFRFRYE